MCGSLCEEAGQPTGLGTSREALCRFPAMKSKKLRKPNFHFTRESVQHNLDGHKAVYGLYFSHLL